MDYNEVLISQAKQCSVCSGSFSEVDPPHIDYNPRTGEVHHLSHKACDPTVVGLDYFIEVTRPTPRYPENEWFLTRLLGSKTSSRRPALSEYDGDVAA